VDGSFDEYVICGLFGIFSLLLIYRSHRADSHTPTARRAIISERAFERALADLLSESPGFKLADELRSGFGKPVVLIPQPFLSEAVTALPFWRNLLQRGDGPSLADPWELLRTACAESQDTVLLRRS
jgi:hypothetical protein